MRDHDEVLEQVFFDIFADYYDLERAPARRYTDDEYTLERMRPLADLADQPEQRLDIIHIAGTKGKGSTAYILSALLTSAGHRCGAFTSPHLATVRERFQVDGSLFAYASLLEHARRFEANLRQNGLKPSLFEIMTVLSMQLFVAEGCRFAVMETGIGGLLDATNYVPHPACCVITPVSFDHTQLLGNTIAEIAAQKAGIIKPGVPVVCARQPYPEAENVIRQRAEQLGCTVVTPVPVEALEQYDLSKLPPFVRDNFRTALAACTVLSIVPDPHAFRMPQLRARCECIRQDPLVVLDGAHNADSAQKLVASLGTLFPNVTFTVVLGVTKGKDAEGILKAFQDRPFDFILTHPRSHKGSELDTLVSLATKAGLSFRVIEHIHSTEQLPSNKALLFTGSFFTALIGEALYG